MSKPIVPHHGAVFNPNEQFHTYIQVPRSIFSDSNLRAGAKLVYTALIKFAEMDGVACPPIKTLSLETGLSIKQVSININRLVKARYLEKVPRFAGGKKVTSEYTFLWKPWFGLDKS